MWCPVWGGKQVEWTCNLSSWGKNHFKYSFCKAKFDQMPNLYEHIASVHEGKKPFKCDKCESCLL